MTLAEVNLFLLFTENLFYMKSKKAKEMNLEFVEVILDKVCYSKNWKCK